MKTATTDEAAQFERVKDQITEQCQEAGFCPVTAAIIWGLGVEAYRAVKARKAVFPHQDGFAVEVRNMAAQQANAQREEMVCH